MKLNPDQKKAIEFGDGPLLIIAGAGTGKTTVITKRITYLITKKLVDPQHILALTFTEKASREMETRVDEELPYGTPEMWISTFHAFCDRILKAEGIHIGLNPGFRILTDAESILLFRKHLFEFHLEYFRPLGNPNKFISGMLTHFDRLRDEDVNPVQYLNWIMSNDKYQMSKKISNNQKLKLITIKDTYNVLRTEKVDFSSVEESEKKKNNELAETYKKWQEVKEKEGYMDYSDLITNTLRLFRIRPNILKRYQEQFHYILIDEFQDTNYAQNELAILLSGKKKNITVVGDDDQSVYKWRGAAVSNMLQFRERFPEVVTVVLTENYRSTQEILDRSYDLIQHNNPDRLEEKEGIDKRLKSGKNVKGDLIEFLFADRVEDEAEKVINEIKNVKCKLKNENGEEQYSYKDFAILVRANNHAEPFVRALSRAGIPYQFLGPGQLLRQGEVKDLIAYLKVLYNFEDNVAMYRIFSMDIFSIPPRDIAVISNSAKKSGISLFETAEQVGKLFVAEKTKEIINKIVDLIHRHLGLLKSDSAGQILYYFLQDSGMLSKIAETGSVKEEQTASNISKFFNRLKTYESEHDDASVFAVVDWIDLSMELGESPLASNSDWTGVDAVNILTVHSSKGLEFPVVFLINCVSARFPSRDKKEQIPIPDALIKEVLPVGDSHMQEERRLFYVGMTRAKNLLYLTAANYYGDGKREKKLSPFLVEAIGDEQIKFTVNSVQKTETQLPLLSEWVKPTEDNNALIIPKEPLTYVSYSQIETFNSCPLQYKYRYIIKIPVPSSAALTFGSTIHAVMQAFYGLVKLGKKVTKETLFALLDTHWSNVGYGKKSYESKMKVHGKELLSEFFDKGFDKKVIPESLEQAFSIRLTPTLKLGGRIDRIDKTKDGKFEIIDYKTGTAPKGRDPRKDLQLSVYAMAATDPGIWAEKPENVIVSFYYLEGQIKVSASRSKEELDSARQTIISTANAIGTTDYHPTPGKHCDFCEFRLICEAWN